MSSVSRSRSKADSRAGVQDPIPRRDQEPPLPRGPVWCQPRDNPSGRATETCGNSMSVIRQRYHRRHGRKATPPSLYIGSPSPEPGSPGSPGRNGALAGYRLEQPSDVWGRFRQFLELGALLPPRSERSPGDGSCRVIGKSGSDNPGKSALSGTNTLRCHAKNRDDWFRVWALQEPVSILFQVKIG